ncbi:hypothetical protein [Allofrancisella guangzhouensis]|nr:hypothetical protein [Allofrancisella guangzhouensis]
MKKHIKLLDEKEIFMTDYEFDVYWYRVLSVVVSTLLKNGLDG